MVRGVVTRTTTEQDRLAETEILSFLEDMGPATRKEIRQHLECFNVGTLTKLDLDRHLGWLQLSSQIAKVSGQQFVRLVNGKELWTWRPDGD